MKKHLFHHKLWYDYHPLLWILVPISWGYRFFNALYCAYLKRFCQIPYNIPVIVIGNITVGGVGKTPLVIALAKKLCEKGLKVGIVSRGYGAKLKRYPYEVQKHDSAETVGDEALMMAQKTNCVVVISPLRTKAVDYLLANHSVQIVLSDDGLQHYRMGRSIEIAVIDGMRGLGNGYCLPAGPLREEPSRLKKVDFIVANEGTWDKAYSMKLVPGLLINLASQKVKNPNEIKESVAAVAAIGNPLRFYSTLQQLGIEFTAYTYPDHYQFKAKDFNYKESMIIMTEKDAVKCRSFNSDKMYYLPVEAQLSDDFWKALWSHADMKRLLAYEY